jgi:CheY-like chemotaxis protein
MGGYMRPLKILHVEDSEEDLILFGRACDAAGVPAVFHRVGDGTQAVSYLKGEGEFRDRKQYPMPDLIILDLNLPGMGGFDFLKWMRRESGLSLPVLVFTVSGDQQDKNRALAEGAAGFFVKPKDFEGLVRLTESFKKFGGNGDGVRKNIVSNNEST